MDLEELEPRKTSGFEIGSDLSKLSLEELKELAETLRKEIKRIETVLSEKESSKSAADSVFKS